MGDSCSVDNGFFFNTIAIYPVDSVIHLSNNLGQKYRGIAIPILDILSKKGLVYKIHRIRE